MPEVAANESSPGANESSLGGLSQKYMIKTANLDIYIYYWALKWNLRNRKSFKFKFGIWKSRKMSTYLRLGFNFFRWSCSSCTAVFESRTFNEPNQQSGQKFTEFFKKTSCNLWMLSFKFIIIYGIASPLLLLSSSFLHWQLESFFCHRKKLAFYGYRLRHGNGVQRWSAQQWVIRWWSII